MSRWTLDRAVLKLSPNASSFLKAYTSNDPAKPRTAFLDLKGRIVATADQILLSPDVALLGVERSAVERLKNHLKTYFFLTGSAFEESPLAVEFDTDPSAAGEHGFQWMGGRIVFTASPAGSAPDEAFVRLRLEKSWPLQDVDYRDELLLSVGDEEYVSYEKGCYLGQEIIARVHYKGKPPRRLAVTDASLAGAAAAMTSCADLNGRQAGFAFFPS